MWGVNVDTIHDPAASAREPRGLAVILTGAAPIRAVAGRSAGAAMSLVSA